MPPHAGSFAFAPKIAARSSAILGVEGEPVGEQGRGHFHVWLFAGGVEGSAGAGNGVDLLWIVWRTGIAKTDFIF